MISSVRMHAIFFRISDNNFSCIINFKPSRFVIILINQTKLIYDDCVLLEKVEK